jgi:cerevisin
LNLEFSIMQLIRSLFSLAFLATAVVEAAPTGNTREEHIVLIDRDDKIPDHVEDVLRRVQMSKTHANVRHVYDNVGFRGFSAYLDGPTAEIFNAMTDVHTVDKTTRVSTYDGVVTGSPWGLERISSTDSMSGDTHQNEFAYRYLGDTLGAGADIYVVDTGIRTTHTVFEGRARMGYSFDPNNLEDEAGHGTHVSGTAAGDWFGVARLANIIGVKVLGADGSGDTSDVIAGIDYVLQQHAARQQSGQLIGSVMSMSLGLSMG